MVEKVRPDSILPSVAMQKNGWNQCHDAFNEALSVERLVEGIQQDTYKSCECGRIDSLSDDECLSIARAIRREVGLDE